MRRFHFRLERILELRRFAESQAEAAFSEKAGRCALLDQALRANAEQTLSLSRQRFRPGGGLSDYRAAEHFSLRLVKEREDLLKALARAEAEKEIARLSYVEAVRARELIDKLREREEAVWYKAASRAEVAVLDDLGALARERRRANAEIGRR